MPTILANLAMHYVEIIHELDGFNILFAQKRFGYAGREIAQILVDIIGPLPKELPTPEDTKPVKITQLNLVQVLNGVVNRSVHEDHHVELFNCFHDVKNGAADLQTMVADFKDYKETKNFAKILDGLMHVGNILVNLPADMKDCSATGVVVKKLSQWRFNFADKAKIAPMIFGNFGKNYVAIISELDLLNQRAAVYHWGNVGRSLGSILNMTIGELPKIQEPKDVDEITITQW